MKCDSFFEIRLYLTGFEKKRTECLLLVMNFIFCKPFQIATLFQSSNSPEAKSKCIGIQNYEYKGTGEPFEVIIKQEPSAAHFVIEKEPIKPM